MNLKRILTTAIPLLSIAIAGCGGGGGGGGDSGSTGSTDTTITSNAQGTTASASGTQGASLSANTATSLSNLASGVGGSFPAAKYRSPLAGKDARFKKLHTAEIKAMTAPKKRFAAAIAKAKAAAKSGAYKTTQTIPSETALCTDGGSYTFSGTYDDVTFAYDITITFSNCKEEGTKTNGAVTSSGAFATTAGGSDSFTMKLGDGDGTVETTDFSAEMYTDASYLTKYAEYLADMTITGSVGMDTAGTSFTFSFNATGKEAYNDYASASDYQLAFSGFSISSTLNASGVTTSNYLLSGADTSNGSVSESWKEAGVNQGLSLSFTNLVTAWSATFNGTASDYYEFAVDGKLSMDFTPDMTCNAVGADGTYTFDTLAPFQVLADGTLTAGHMIINDNTHVEVQSGAVVVYLTGETGTTYATLDDLEQTCAIQDLEDDGDAASTTVTSGQTVSGTSGKSLVANLAWTPNYAGTSGATTSILDLHVNFYAASSYSGSAPTSTTTGTWYIDWHNRDQANVLPDDDADGVPGEDSTVTFPNGIVDGNLEYYSASNSSSTEGFDFDRLVIDNLPAGYYVVSVNSYALGGATSVTASVDIKIGDTVYDFGTHAFGVADTEGTTAGAWWTVCHLRVNSDGTVDILPATTASLEPWHDGAFNMLAPAAKKALGARGK